MPRAASPKCRSTSPRLAITTPLRHRNITYAAAAYYTEAPNYYKTQAPKYYTSMYFFLYFIYFFI
jgi:hypothetical protein